ncbi:hypothetical protein VEE68_54590 (plasmid) [Escherichia coli]|nr:hypothetical protein VEE68_54590 [Escherichia coli]
MLSDWAGDYSHPALKYIETRWASMISYEMTTRLLKDILPVGHSLNASTVRNHLCQVAQRLDAEAEAHSGFLSGCLPRLGEPAQARKTACGGYRWWLCSRSG